MTINEAEALAQEGNVDAMVALADYYMDQQKLGSAKRWYDTAADRGNLKALYMSVSLAPVDADITLKITGNMSDVCDVYIKAWDYYSRGLNYPDLNDEARSIFLELNENNSLALNVGHSFTMSNRYDEGIDFMSAYDKDPRFSVLLGVCYTLEGKNPVRADYLEKGYLYLRVLDSEMPEIPTDALYLALGCLEIDYLQADDIRMKSTRTDITAAYNCACKIASLSGYEDLGRERLSHYRKKMFGGYMYVK
ncbi:MAG: hypothetical protein LUH18_00340 [Oscillospiraceae bacterium]|nr:hypothetical protein [Oscillospiraceae bacterium]